MVSHRAARWGGAASRSAATSYAPRWPKLWTTASSRGARLRASASRARNGPSLPASSPTTDRRHLSEEKGVCGSGSSHRWFLRARSAARVVRRRVSRRDARGCGAAGADATRVTPSGRAISYVPVTKMPPSVRCCATVTSPQSRSRRIAGRAVRAQQQLLQHDPRGWTERTSQLARRRVDHERRHRRLSRPPTWQAQRHRTAERPGPS